MAQETLALKVEQEIKSVEQYKFETEPIKGFPELRWRGKRPFTNTQFYPAQLKESHGSEVNGWMNKIFWGDNLQVMSHLLKQHRGNIDLIYIDPPFDSKADYKKKITVRGANLKNDSSTFEEKQYTDIWSNDEYLQFMYERLIILRELLSPTGTIFLHCDYHKNYHLRAILDEIYGPENFINEIVWKRTTAHGDAKQGAKRFDIVHDNIIIYAKNISRAKWNTQYIPFGEDQIQEQYNKVDENGRKYRLVTPTASKPGGDTQYEFRGVRPPSGRYWAYTREKMEQFDTEGKLYFSSTGQPYIKYFLDERPGVAASSIWTDIGILSPTSNERVDYPTQKPVNLLDRIIKTSTSSGDLVFDCFMGSGTTQAVAMKLGRRFIGADINLGAVQTTTKRLLNIANELKGQLQDETKYTGFQIYNVNHYDVFRNPIQAKDILIKALEIQPLPNNNVYDGEKDGRMVKIMPINWIASRADLNELITNFDYKAFEKANEKNPGKPVEHLLLVCMGHEPDLAASLQSAVPTYKLDIEVVDILRDNARLEFKRDAEAEIVIVGNRLVIREFYPMNLLQKLSLMKEDAAKSWKELVDSVMVDFNYDGAVFEPQIVDVPKGNDLVKGIYNIPANAGTIRVKITDLLSETLEQTVKNG